MNLTYRVNDNIKVICYMLYSIIYKVNIHYIILYFYVTEYYIFQLKPF